MYVFYSIQYITVKITDLIARINPTMYYKCKSGIIIIIFKYCIDGANSNSRNNLEN